MIADFVPSREFYSSDYFKLLRDLGAQIRDPSDFYYFETSTKMADAVQMMARKRNEYKATKNTVMSDLYKLIMNSCYGVYGQNVENYSDVKVVGVRDRARFRKLEASPYFKKCEKFGDNLVSCEMHKQTIVYDKLPFVSKAILDRSKMLLLEFVYYDLIPAVGFDNLDLLGTDTDSIHFRVKNGVDPYECFCKMKRFDYSSVPRDLLPK